MALAFDMLPVFDLLQLWFTFQAVLPYGQVKHRHKPSAVKHSAEM